VNTPTYYIDGLFRQANAALARTYLGITGGGGGFTPANLTETISGVLLITGGANAVNGAGTKIQVIQASGAQAGFLSAAAFSAFNSKPNEAPIDGSIYGRLNGAWSVVPSAPATGNLTESTSGVLTITGGTGAVVGAGTTIKVQKADGTHDGYVSSADWNTFNGKQPAGSYLTDAPNDGTSYARKNAAWSAIPGALSTGNLTEVTSAILTITNGVGAVVGAGTSLQVQKSDTTHDGYLSSTDWNTFNGKVPAARTIATTAPITGGGDLSANRTLAIAKATSLVDGYLDHGDFATFNGKLSDAASDGNTYGRKNGAWATVAASTDVLQAQVFS
jgi:hypothetical protein